jgi:hypothetical protein
LFERREKNPTKQSHFESFAARPPEIASSEIATLRFAISSSQ